MEILSRFRCYACSDPWFLSYACALEGIWPYLPDPKLLDAARLGPDVQWNDVFPVAPTPVTSPGHTDLLARLRDRAAAPAMRSTILPRIGIGRQAREHRRRGESHSAPPAQRSVNQAQHRRDVRAQQRSRPMPSLVTPRSPWIAGRPSGWCTRYPPMLARPWSTSRASTPVSTSASAAIVAGYLPPCRSQSGGFVSSRQSEQSDGVP